MVIFIWLNLQTEEIHQNINISTKTSVIFWKAFSGHLLLHVDCIYLPVFQSNLYVWLKIPIMASWNSLKLLNCLLAKEINMLLFIIKFQKEKFLNLYLKGHIWITINHWHWSQKWFTLNNKIMGNIWLGTNIIPPVYGKPWLFMPECSFQWIFNMGS